jgi:hypothetical protein
MNAWLLLIFTVVCAYITYDSFQWRGSIKRSPFSVISNMCKSGLEHLNVAEQEKVKGLVASYMGGGQFCWIFLLITILCAVCTVQAFLE